MPDRKPSRPKEGHEVDPAYTAKEFTWIRLWFHYLQANTNYEKYCKAIRDTNELAAQRLRNTYPEIHRIHSDFGDLYLDNSGSKVRFDTWITTRIELFFPTSGEATLARTSQNKENSTIITIPHTLEVEPALEQIGKLLSSQYDLGFHRKPEPRYKVYPNGRLSNDRATGLYKALKVYYMFKARDAGSKIYKTAPSIAAELSVQDDVYWDWNLDPAQLERYAAGKLTKDDLDSKTRRVHTQRAYAKRIIANTIVGKFPCED